MVIQLNNAWNDYELIYLYRCGEQKALQLLLKKHMGAIKSVEKELLEICYLLDKNDVYQELLVTFIKCIDSYSDERGNFFSYLYICLKRCAARLLKNYFSPSEKIHYQAISLDEPMDALNKTSLQDVLSSTYYNTDPVHAYQMQELEIQYQYSKQFLNDKELQFFTLYENGINTNQIAKIANMTPKQVRNYLNRAKLKMRKKLDLNDRIKSSKKNTID